MFPFDDVIMTDLAPKWRQIITLINDEQTKATKNQFKVFEQAQSDTLQKAEQTQDIYQIHACDKRMLMKDNIFIRINLLKKFNHKFISRVYSTIG